MPVALDVLLNLNKIDRSILADAFEEFQKEGREDRISELRPDNIVKLYLGLKVDNVAFWCSY